MLVGEGSIIQKTMTESELGEGIVVCSMVGWRVVRLQLEELFLFLLPSGEKILGNDK